MAARDAPGMISQTQFSIIIILHQVQTNMKTLAQMGVSDDTNLVMVSVESTPAFMSRG